MARKKHKRLPLSTTQMKRQRAMEDVLIRGQGSVSEMAVMFGVSDMTAKKDIRQIKQRWMESLKDQAGTNAPVRIRQLDLVIRSAFSSYEISTKKKIEVHTTTRQKRCEDCVGTGFASKVRGEGEWCVVCGGEGEVEEEVVTKKITGQAGDAQFLSVAKSAIVEAAKIEGVYPDRVIQAKHEGEIGIEMKGQVDFKHAHLMASMKIEGDLPREAILDVFEAVEKMNDLTRASQSQEETGIPLLETEEEEDHGEE